MIRFAACSASLVLTLAVSVFSRNGPPTPQSLELKPEWNIDLKKYGSRPSRNGYFGAPDNPGSISSVACDHSVVAVTIDEQIVFFSIETGKVVGAKDLSLFPITRRYPGGFARISSADDERFLVELNEPALYGGEARQRIVLIDSQGSVIHSLVFSNTTGSFPVVGFAVSTTGKSFLLCKFDSDEGHFQLRDSSTFALKQSWSAKESRLNLTSLSDDMLLSVQPQPLGPGSHAGKEQPVEIGLPGTEPHQIAEVSAGGASVLADDRIVVIHANELSADLVDDSGRVMRTYNVPFSAPHLYFQVASIAPDGRYFAAHFLGQKIFFLPGREYLYLWCVDQSDPIAAVHFKWDRYYESQSAFCSDDRKFAVVNNEHLELFNLANRMTR